MKRFLALMGLAVSATLCLTNCTEQIEETPENLASGEFSINVVCDAATRTAMDGDATGWSAGDALNVFHAVSGSTTYGSNDSFTIAEADLTTGRFTGTLKDGDLDPTKSYDWYALYPYKTGVNSPVNTKGFFPIGSSSSANAQVQDGNDSKKHLAGKYFPLYAKVTASGSESPTLTMKQALSVVKVHVTNTLDDALTVSSVKFTANEPIAGTFYIDFSGDAPSFTGSGDNYVSSAATLNVTDGAAIAKDGSADFYIAVKPFTAASATDLKVAVNGYEKTITLTKDVTFSPGKIKTINFNYDGEAEIPTYGSLAGLVDAGTPTAEGALVNVTFDNETIVSKSSNSVKFTASEQNVTVYCTGVPSDWKAGGWVNGTLSSCTWILYSGNTWELVPTSWSALTCNNPVESPVITITSGSATITCATEGATVRYTTDGSDPTESSSVYTTAVVLTDGQTIKAKAFKAGYPSSAIVSEVCSGNTKVIVIDGTKLTTTATSAESTIKYGNLNIVFSANAKCTTSNLATNHFGSQQSILIGKSGAYIYNADAIPGTITKFEVYANYGASSSVTVGINFSASQITAYDADAENTYKATLSTLDSVYDCSSSLPEDEDARYFWYQVTNAKNSQVQFRITYLPDDSGQDNNTK